MVVDTAVAHTDRMRENARVTSGGRRASGVRSQQTITLPVVGEQPRRNVIIGAVAIVLALVVLSSMGGSGAGSSRRSSSSGLTLRDTEGGFQILGGNSGR